MNCQEVNEKIYKYCDGEVSPQEHANITLHLDKCPVCRQICQLTLIENEVLREIDDIPNLSPEFTSMVMSSLQTGSIAVRSGGNGFQRIKGKIWLGSTIAAAAIILFLYIPQLKVIENRFIHSDKSSQQVQYSATGNGLGSVSDQAAAPIIPKLPNDTDNKHKTAETTIKPDKPAAKTENTTSVPMVAEALPSPQTIMDVVSNVNRAGSSAKITTEAVVTSDERPTNMPDKFKFVQVSNTGDITIYNYASLDGVEYLQLTIKPYSDTTVNTQVLSDNSTLPQASPVAVYRNIQIGNRKVTVIFFGNLSLQEMNKLADTVQFPN